MPPPLTAPSASAPPTGTDASSSPAPADDSTSDSTGSSRPLASFRLPAYAPDEAELWLVQVECAFAVAGITNDVQKFKLLVANLPVHVASQVRDVVTREPGSFQDLKTALRSRLAQSRASRLETLLRDQHLGDQKPTQLLRNMQHMLGNSGSDVGLLRTLFLQRLPQATRAALALLPEDSSIENLASAADRFQDASGGATVSAVAASSSANATCASVPATSPCCNAGCDPRADINSDLVAAVSALTTAVAQIQANMQNRGSGARRRSRSRPRQPARSDSSAAQALPPTADDMDRDGYCWYHRKFGAEAHRCSPPCSWRAEN